jgi:hypothetical protein
VRGKRGKKWVDGRNTTLKLAYCDGLALVQVVGCNLNAPVTLWILAVTLQHSSFNLFPRPGGGQPKRKSKKWEEKTTRGFQTYSFKNILVHSLIAQRLQMGPVEGGFARARAAAKQDNVERVAFGEGIDAYTDFLAFISLQCLPQPPRRLSARRAHC